jgi:hypothetical protein
MPIKKHSDWYHFDSFYFRSSKQVSFFDEENQLKTSHAATTPATTLLTIFLSSKSKAPKPGLGLESKA